MDEEDISALFETIREQPRACLLEAVLTDQRRRYRTGCALSAETYLEGLPALAADSDLKLQLVLGEVRCRQETGEHVDGGAIVLRFPDLQDSLIESLTQGSDESMNSSDSSTTEDQDDVNDIQAPPRKSPIHYHSRKITRVGKYRIDRELGEGGFGKVFLAEDEELRRWVALKLLRPERLSSKSYLEEARMLARLDHPGIVPVYDAGQSENGLYVASKLIEGVSIQTRMATSRPSCTEAVNWIVQIAESLHYAHSRGLIHRDVKPANILLDTQGNPVLIDFGLALAEEQFGHGARSVGTLRYMSPEQARGEGHLVDARSDVFSLGVVLYEMISGTRPFPGNSRHAVRERILHEDPPSLSVDEIPAELIRICLKSLSKRARDRYDTASAFAEDLRAFIEGGASTEAIIAHPIARGLRSFESHDADFFLTLLPGPRDRNGLPESIGFWKDRVDGCQDEALFRIGLIYGPSGCGKSSWMKAGLIPRLSSRIIPIYLEATPNDTEERLLNRLRTCCPQLSPNWDLVESLSVLRRGDILAFNQRVVIIIDQFEQWLHAHKGKEHTPIAQALRQCDGNKLQCLLLVRDDFWLIVSRFFAELEVDLLQNQNTMLIDLFEVDHAKQVLMTMGHTLGRWPKDEALSASEPKRFAETAIAALSNEGKVVPVHLALLIDLLKNKVWSRRTIRDAQSHEGIGMWFLREIFETNAEPRFRHHEKAARSVLSALLPEPGNPLKGTSCSYWALMKTSGYHGQEDVFQDLLCVLDGETRLITPVGGSEDPSMIGSRHYQLTHDFMVSALRQWLNEKQLSTRRGRAQLRLAENAFLWKAKPARQRLPGIFDWLSFLRLTESSRRSETQSRMLKAATRLHLTRIAILLVGLCILGLTGHVLVEKMRAQMLVDQLLQAEIQEAPSIISKLSINRKRERTRLDEVLQEGPGDASRQLRASLALLAVDDAQIPFLQSKILTASPSELAIITQALMPKSESATESLWNSVQRNESIATNERFRVACALAAIDSENAAWETPLLQELIVSHLVEEPDGAQWTSLLTRVSKHLIPSLTRVFDESEKDTEGNAAASILVAFLAKTPERLPDLIEQAPHPSRLRSLVAGLSSTLPEHRIWLRRRLENYLDEGRRNTANDRRLANLGAALVVLGDYDSVRPLLTHQHDPQVSSFLIEWLVDAGADPARLEKWLYTETDPAIQRSLLLAMGPMRDGFHRLPQWKSLIGFLQNLHQTNSDPGVHSAVAWLLRTWYERVDSTPLNRVTISETSRHDFESNWFVNEEGQTLVVLSTHAQFGLGGPPHDGPRRLFAIGATEVTEEEFRRAFPGPIEASTGPSCPISSLTYHQKAHYCVWLSEKDGIPEHEWCYERAGGNNWQRRPDYLSRTGYRLPTETEWGFACRAGTTTVRPQGNSDELISAYSWHLDNSDSRVHPVALLKPNHVGLFDLLGNLAESCEISQGIESLKMIDRLKEKGRRHWSPDTQHWVRGGAFFGQGQSMRSDYYFTADNSDSSFRIGFRIARTIPQHKTTSTH